MLLALEGALVDGVVCLSPAATENVNLFVFLHTMIQILGRISRRTLLSAPLVRPFQLAFKKLANFPMVLFNFLKNLKRWWWWSHSATRPSKELWIGPITTAPTWWKVRYNNSSFIWMGHTSAHQPSFYSFTFHLHFLYFSLFR